MTSNKPLTVDGKTYPLFSINLAITGTYNPDSNMDAAVSARLIPTRIEADTVETLDSQAKSFFFGTLSNADTATQAAMATIASAIQAWIDAKGI